MAEVTKTAVTVYNANLLSYYDIPKYWEEREDGWEGCFTVDYPKGNVVDFESIGEVTHSRTACVGMCNYYDFMAAIDEFLSMGLEKWRLYLGVRYVHLIVDRYGFQLRLQGLSNSPT